DAHDDVETLADLLVVDDQRRAEDADDDGQRAHRGKHAPQRRAPAAGVADGEHDGKGLDPFDQTGHERGDRGNGERQQSGTHSGLPVLSTNTMLLLYILVRCRAQVKRYTRVQPHSAADASRAPSAIASNLIQAMRG